MNWFSIIQKMIAARQQAQAGQQQQQQGPQPSQQTAPQGFGMGPVGMNV
jgi:hypothetical protein